MRNITRHKSLLCFLLILSLILPLLSVTESKAFEHTGDLEIKCAHGRNDWSLDSYVVKGSFTKNAKSYEQYFIDDNKLFSIDGHTYSRTTFNYSANTIIQKNPSGVDCYIVDCKTLYIYNSTNKGGVWVINDQESIEKVLYLLINGYPFGVDAGKDSSFYSNQQTCIVERPKIANMLNNSFATTVMKQLALLGLGMMDTSTLSTTTRAVGADTFELLTVPQTIQETTALRFAGVVLDTDEKQNYKVTYDSVDITNLLSPSNVILRRDANNENAVVNQVSVGFPNLAKAMKDNIDILAKYHKASQSQATDEDVQSYDSAYDYYAARIAGFDGSDSAKAELNAFPASPDRMPDELALTGEQKLRLKVFASILAKGGSNSKELSSGFLQSGASTEWQWVPTASVGEVNISDNSSAHSLADLVEQANALYEGRYSEYSAQANPTPDLECTNAYAVAIYYAAIMYGAEPTTGSVEGYRQIHKMDYVESVTVKKDDSVSVGNIDFSYKREDGSLSYHGIPAMTRINYIADSEDARNAYYNLNQLIMIIASFCNENEKQYQEGTSDWYKTLKNVDDKANIANTEAISTLKKNINLVRSAINIKKTLDYLGVDITWIPAVKTVCDAGNALNDYDNVVLDMNVAYEANESEPMNTFFNLSEGKFSDDYLIGIALSSTFRPMSTNMYSL